MPRTRSQDEGRTALASDLYTPQQLVDMARRLDECIEISAVCMDLASAGALHRRAIAGGGSVVASRSGDGSDAPLRGGEGTSCR